MGPVCRLIGSKGIDGDGTKHDIEHVDPFLFCDYVCLEGTDLKKPPFCAHPHTGVAVATILCEGDPLNAWDNVQGFEKDKLYPGGVYLLRSGRGCVHDEGGDPISIGKASSAPFGLPGGDRPARNLRLVQLWFDAGQLHGGGDAPVVSSSVVSPEAVPTAVAGPMRLRVLLGRYGDCCGVDVPATVLHGALLPFQGQAVLQVPTASQGFLFVMGRAAKISLLGEEHSVGLHEMMLLPAKGEAYDVAVEPSLEDFSQESPQSAKADDALEILLGFGPPSGKPFYKLLGYGGAVVASSEEKARALMRKYEQDPRSFGISEGTIPADSSRFGLQQGYKDPLDGKGECQRSDAEASAPEARFYEVEKGPFQPKGKL